MHQVESGRNGQAAERALDRLRDHRVDETGITRFPRAAATAGPASDILTSVLDPDVFGVGC